MVNGSLRTGTSIYFIISDQDPGGGITHFGNFLRKTPAFQLQSAILRAISYSMWRDPRPHPPLLPSSVSCVALCLRDTSTAYYCRDPSVGWVFLISNNTSCLYFAFCKIPDYLSKIRFCFCIKLGGTFLSYIIRSCIMTEDFSKRSKMLTSLAYPIILFKEKSERA